MSLKRTRMLTGILLVLGLGIGLVVFFFKQHITNIYNETVKPTSFQNVVLEKDTATNSTFPLKNLPVDSSAKPTQQIRSSSYDNGVLNSMNQTAEQVNALNTASQSNNTTAAIKKGKEIKARDIPLLHAYNSRVRLTTFFSKFKQGDYISGLEFSDLYRRDPSIGKVAKTTICGFIEKNIRQLTRNGNAFIIETVNANGVHMKLKIPFVEDLQINIENGARVILGETFTSNAPAFNKSILLPIQLELIDIVNNGEQFPKNGYISGDYYFIDYSKTKMAYKLK